jgi:hypothetical protein
MREIDPGNIQTTKDADFHETQTVKNLTALIFSGVEGVAFKRMALCLFHPARGL